MAKNKNTYLYDSAVPFVKALHEAGLLHWDAVADQAQASITLIVGEEDTGRTGFKPFMRLASQSSEEDGDATDRTSMDIPIDMETYDLFTKGIPDL